MTRAHIEANSAKSADVVVVQRLLDLFPAVWQLLKLANLEGQLRAKANVEAANAQAIGATFIMPIWH